MSMSQPPPRASNASGFGPPPQSISPFTGAPNAPYAPHAPPMLMPPNPHTPFAPSPGPPGATSALSLAPSRHEPPPLSATLGPMPGTLERPIHGPKKRIIMTCDGTWVDQDNGLMNGHKEPPSNVSRIGWAIKDTSRDGIPQVVNYQAGVGTSGGKISRLVGGALGLGIKENIREAYSYIATNYRDGDEIFLIGFSRGAFTARSVGGIIGELGLLTRKGLPHFPEIFEDFENKLNERYVSRFPDIPFRNKPEFGEGYVRTLVKHGMTRMGIPIKAICVWDTVGSLGIPVNPILLSGNRRVLKQYQFDDTRIHQCVENAFQALSLDEGRAAFTPAIWEKDPATNNRTNLKQVWFPGVHSNVGGGYDDQEIADITLAWMMSRLEPFLDFRGDFLISQYEQTKAYYKSTRQRPRAWSMGEIYRTVKGAYALLGSKTRTPGAYHRIDPYTGRPTSKRLKNTNEYIHASVRSRIGLKGPGMQDRGEYAPQAMADWTFDPESVGGGPGTPGQGGNLGNGGLVVWNYRGEDGGRNGRDGQDRIPEAVLLETELALLRQFREVDDFIKYMRPPTRGHREKRRSRRHGEPNGFGPDSTLAPPMSSMAGRLPPPGAYMNGGLAPSQGPGMGAQSTLMSRPMSAGPGGFNGSVPMGGSAWQAMNEKRRSMGFVEGEIGADGKPIGGKYDDDDDDDNEDDPDRTIRAAGANEGRRRHRRKSHRDKERTSSLNRAPPGGFDDSPVSDEEDDEAAGGGGMMGKINGFLGGRRASGTRERNRDREDEDMYVGRHGRDRMEKSRRRQSAKY